MAEEKKQCAFCGATDDDKDKRFIASMYEGVYICDECVEICGEYLKGFKKAKSEAKKWVADVGYSEHQTGLAVDINADGVNSSGQQVYAWLADNAWKYGFILRYPEDKTEITKTDYEPWHYRYVGAESAAKIYESGLCLEEYIGMMN